MARFASGPRSAELARRIASSALSLAALAGGLVPACVDRNVYLVPSSETSSSAGQGVGSAPPAYDGSTRGFDAGTGSGGTGSCQTVRHHQVPQPLGVYMMVDQSPSMESAWPAVVSALKNFIADSRMLVDVSIGVQFFALTPTLSNSFLTWPQAACTVGSYVIPDVPIHIVPANELFLLHSLDTHGPDVIAQVLAQNFGAWLPDSPMDMALSGAILGARNWSFLNFEQNPKVVVLLVTAGGPSSALSLTCDAPLAGAIAAAQGGVLGAPSISTYVLGVGDQLDSLNQIAAAGSTDSAYLLPSDTVDSEILGELQKIRAVALPCELDVDPTALAQGNVNVELGLQSFVRVDDEGACQPGNTLEWFQSNDPDGGLPKIELCPSTCQAVRTVSEATLDVAYGCPTIVAQ